MEFEKLSTKRIALRSIKPEDARALFNYRCDAQTNKYQGWIPKTIKDAEEFINKNPKDFNQPQTWYQLMIIEIDTNAIIGDVGVHFIDEHQVEIGITLDKEKHGKGYASEAIIMLLEFLFLKLNKHRVIGSVDPRNISSISMLKRLGFRMEAHFVESYLTEDGWADDMVFALLKSEWINNKS